MRWVVIAILCPNEIDLDDFSINNHVAIYLKKILDNTIAAWILACEQANSVSSEDGSTTVGCSSPKSSFSRNVSHNSTIEEYQQSATQPEAAPLPELNQTVQDNDNSANAKTTLKLT